MIDWMSERKHRLSYTDSIKLTKSKYELIYDVTENDKVQNELDDELYELNYGLTENDKVQIDYMTN